MHEGPASPAIQRLAKEWQEKSEELFQGNKAFMQKVSRYLEEEDEYPLDKAFIHFMQEALTLLKQREKKEVDIRNEKKKRR